MDYGDRAAADRRLLTYTSASLPHDLELTGRPVVHLRIAIAGADDDLFPRVPAEGEPIIRVLRGSAAPSRIELPRLPRTTTGS